MKGVDPQHGSRLLVDILQDTGVTLADIAGCEQAKTALEEVFSDIFKMKLFFKSNNSFYF